MTSPRIRGWLIYPSGEGYKADVIIRTMHRSEALNKSLWSQKAGAARSAIAIPFRAVVLSSLT